MDSKSFAHISKIFIDVAKQQIILHGNAIKNLTIHYMINDINELKKIYTTPEIRNITYMPFNSVKYYFPAIIKNHYNFTELTIISICIYNNMLNYLYLSDILFTAIKNYYGRGNIDLNQDNTEEFINQVMIQQQKRNFNPDTIRSHIKKVKLIKLLVLSIIKVFDEHIITVLDENCRKTFELHKGVQLQSIKNIENNTNFEGNIDDIKKEFKKNDKKNYNSIIQILDNISCDFHDVYSHIYYQITNNITENQTYLYKIYKKELKNLLNFVKHPEFKICEIVNNINTDVIGNNPLYMILKDICENAGRYKFIKAYEQKEPKKQPEQQPEQQPDLD